MVTRVNNADRAEFLVRHLSQLLCRAAGSDELSETVKELVRSTAAGHIALDIAGLSGDTAAIRTMLHASAIVGRPGEYRPLVFDNDDRLYLYRYWDYERRVADALLQRAAINIKAHDTELFSSELDRLFADPRAKRQKLAAAIAAMRGLTVVTGGPGTGKTTAVVKILALLLRLQPGLRIALAAPTGKAAMRVGDAVREAKSGLPTEGLREQLPHEAATLHRLLQLYPGHSRYGADNRLPYDVVVVDEASMVGVALMAQLLEALADDSRLILLGDKDQLASVEPGSVLGDICSGNDIYSTRLQQQLAGVGIGIAAQEQQRHALQDNVVVLDHSFRFSADSGIGQLADSVRAGDSARALELLRDPAQASVQLHEADTARAVRDAVLPWLLSHLRSYMSAIDASTDPAEALACFEKFRLLCAVRHGSTGVAGMNALAEQSLAESGLADTRDTWYAGRPVMITRNDYQQQLFNGDVGVTLRLGEESRVVFASADGVRLLSPPRLPEHVTVYAMTVHKSQGSEFDDVALVVPGQDNELLGRELAYTAVTRARNSVNVFGSSTALVQAIQRVSQRTSGLAANLLLREAGQPEQRSLF